MKKRTDISAKAWSTTLGAALPLPALAAANPSCIVPTNVHYLRSQPFNPHNIPGIPNLTVYVWGFTCANGQTDEYQAVSPNETAANVTNRIIATFTGEYSSSKAASVVTWSTRAEVTSALAANPKYDPGKFTYEERYPDLKPAMPFNGQNDDITIPQTFSGAIRALVKISYTSDPRYFAMAYVFPGVGNTNLFDKPLVVGDAFDPMNKRNAWQIYGAPKTDGTFGYKEYKNLLSTTGVSPRAKGSWDQLSVPAAHEMLFGHFYNNAADLVSTASHNAFYNQFLQGLGEYRKDKPSVAIAYSNFFRPHASVSPSKMKYGAHIATAGVYDINVGAPDGNPPHPERHEMMPGSTADQFFDPFNYTLASGVWGDNAGQVVYPGYSMSNSTVISRFSSDMTTSASANNTEVFKGTFIPTTSALDLKNFNPLAPPTLDETAMAAYSPFDKVIYMKQTYNGYRGEFDKGSGQGIAVNDKRYKHIIFGAQLMEALSESLDYVERNSNQHLAAINSLLLN